MKFFYFRQSVDHLRREHEQTIQRLKQLKQEELSTALDVTTHTKAAFWVSCTRNGLVNPIIPGISIFSGQE